jgi:hypothetical protein
MTVHIFPTLVADNKPATTFRPAGRAVEMNGLGGPVRLDMAQCDHLLNLYQREARAAERTMRDCHALFYALWEARCAVVDANGGVPPAPEAA